jgi:signal transduction histidine kinase
MFMDGGRISLATTQLIRNAIEAIEAFPEAPRRIGVEAQTADGHLEIRVSDEGVGTSDELLSRIDEPFFTTKAGALGMGLNVVRSVVHNHGGEVVIRHNHPRGLAVTMRLRRLSPL